MSNVEILHTYDGSRAEFRPYGLTCERWAPDLMPKPDRHNEIEINYFPDGEMTYLFHDRKVTIPPRRLSLFWGLVPHQIVHYEGSSPYYVCTVPFSQFLGWKLPASFVDRILKEEVLTETSSRFSSNDEFMLSNWINDIEHIGRADLILLEMHARLLRMAGNVPSQKENPVEERHAVNLVERIAIYIARNYSSPMKVSEIGEAVGLHPDYANTLFKKSFGCTMYDYLVRERITHAQRKLVLSGAPITEIAFECGFNSINRFNAAFLKINGCTPREYRKNNW